jgi:hypothetical protein
MSIEAEVGLKLWCALVLAVAAMAWDSPAMLVAGAIMMAWAMFAWERMTGKGKS